jgi:hypothetical protein
MSGNQIPYVEDIIGCDDSPAILEFHHHQQQYESVSSGT